MEFPFPFTPYKIQQDFMESLYQTLKNGNLGIFESPTGTGKSLSIICGSLKWLKDHTEQVKNDLSCKITTLVNEKEKYANEKVDWLSAKSKEIEITRQLNELKIQEKQINEYEQKIQKLISNKPQIQRTYINKDKPNSIPAQTEETNVDDEECLLLEEAANCSDNDSEDEADPDTIYQPTQIIIASRTHSQLSQFVGEIKRSPYGKDIRVVSLASRQNYCINPAVKQLKNMTLINERCLDMQKRQKQQSKVDSDGKVVKKQKSNSCTCPFFKQANVDNLRDFALSEVQDIEDLVQAGREVNACPYYASRKAAEDAEVLLVPYNTLLHKSTREASGIKLKNNVIIIDEAHNLLEALAQMHGSELNYPQLYYSLHSLKCYKNRYNTMFSATTLRVLNQLIFVIQKLLLLLEKDCKEETSDIFSLGNFVHSAGIDQYNFFNIVKFCKASKLAQKVRSYSIKYPVTEQTITKKPPAKKGVKDFLSSIGNKNRAATVPEKVPETPKFPIPNNPLLAVVSFLECLTYSSHDGRLLVTQSPEKANCKLQFLLLNPTSNFTEIVNDARSVIVAGGTMKPNAEFRDRLFKAAGADYKRIVEFSCDHIIPQQNILPIALSKGLKGEKLLFNFTTRMSMGSTIKDILQQACTVVKGGIVVFFSSYNYENWVYQQVSNVDFGRVLFREPQKSGSVDDVLNKYASTIKKSKNGAMMFSVVGGKLSEGLNFSDDLGRCVIVVGLPYANLMAKDLKEKMAYLDKTEGQGAGQQFYGNLCMKAVNQCIGRAVRHRNDYAAVLLLDERYAKPAVKNSLPDWIKRSLKISEGAEAFKLMSKFFKERESETLY